MQREKLRGVCCFSQRSGRVGARGEFGSMGQKDRVGLEKREGGGKGESISKKKKKSSSALPWARCGPGGKGGLFQSTQRLLYEGKGTRCRGGERAASSKISTRKRRLTPKEGRKKWLSKGRK